MFRVSPAGSINDATVAPNGNQDLSWDPVWTVHTSIDSLGWIAEIEIPLAWPAILTAAMLTFAHTLGEFGVVLMVGGNLPGETRTLSIAIYDRMQAFDDRAAGVMAATLLVISVVTLMTTTALSRRVARRG